jgi:hypothetical protein
MTWRARNLSPAAAARLTMDAEPYLSCDNCFEQVDAHVDAMLSGSAESLPPEFRAHLIGCAACRHEARSLLELAAQDVGADHAPVLAKFDQEMAPPGDPHL